MNDIAETTLRAQRWRDPPPEFLGRVLEQALEARACATKRRSLMAFIPRPLRLPLAACWLLAFFFRVTTPEAIPQATLDGYAKLPPMTPQQMLAHLKQVEQLADELLHPRHHGPIPPL
jgi:hypothetical protein